ncbi:MAG: transposase [Candidatus Omnitrophica bacterium]|nr:transposase [Candidatus Omnitrophota bacterium]
MPRTARIVGAGYLHHIIQRGNNRQAVFFDDEDRRVYLKLLKKYTDECNCKIKAYCLMNNHIHLLLIPQHDNSLSKTMQKLSLRYTQYINSKYKRTGRLWECRFHSSVVDRERYLWSVCRYIERNPIRAKIVNEPVKYKWSSAKVNTSLDQQDNLVEPIWQDHLEREEYIKFLNQPDNKDEIGRIRKSTFGGIPMGTDEFLKDIAKTLGVIIKIRPRGRPRKMKK